MATLQARTRIIDVVQRHCGNRDTQELLKEMEKVSTFGKASMASPGRGRLEAKQDFTVTDNELLDQLITLCQRNLPREEVPPALLEIGDIFKTTGEMQRAIEVYSLVLSLNEGSGKARRENVDCAEALLRRGEVQSCLGRWRESRADLAQSRSLFASMRQKIGVGRVDNILGTNYAEQGNLALARKFFQRAYSVFEASEQKELSGTVLMNLGILLNIRGQYDEALSHYRRAISYFEQLGDVRRLAQIHHNIGMTHLHLERNTEAIKEFNLAYFLASKQNLVPVMATAVFGKADACYRRQDLALALKLCAQAVELFEKCSDRLGQADAYKLKGMISRDLKTYALATSYFETSIRLNKELGNKLNTAEAQYELGIMERKRRRPQAALDAFGTAMALFREVGASGQTGRLEREIQSLKTRHHEL